NILEDTIINGVTVERIDSNTESIKYFDYNNLVERFMYPEFEKLLK
ncbi:hypothetical protein BMETH_3140114034, partial [methanotrophic bacterial endosymbiont of Bathymodiolus sp.]